MATAAMKIIPITRKLTQVFLPLMCSQNGTVRYSTNHTQLNESPSSVKTKQINKHLQLREIVDGSPGDSEERPLVLLYSWLVAKTKHINKYGDYYLGKGYDVLNIKIDPLPLLWPAKTQKLAQEVLEITTDSIYNKRPLIVHAFSVGGYLFGETLVKMENIEKYRPVGNRILGQIFDSPVDFHGIPSGFSKAVTQNPVLRKTLQAGLTGYLKVMQKPATRHYLRASAAFKNNLFKTPSLFLYSIRDPVCDPETVEGVVKNWETRGLRVNSKCWEKSPHVSHFHYYPDEYTDVLDKFLEGIHPSGSMEINQKLLKIATKVKAEI